MSNYYHTILKDELDVNRVYKVLEKILKEGYLKSPKLLNENGFGYNGEDYVSIARYHNMSKYKIIPINENRYNNSKLTKLFNSYQEYLKYLELDDEIEGYLSKEEYFKKYNTTNKNEYYEYLEDNTRSYPIDIKELYLNTGNEIYKYILDIIDDDILYCYRSEYAYNKYVLNSHGITFVFPSNLETEEVKLIPNLPLAIEREVVANITKFKGLYTNIIGEYQVKDRIAINKAIEILINKNIDKKIVEDLLDKYNYDIKIAYLEQYEVTISDEEIKYE